MLSQHGYTSAAAEKANRKYRLTGHFYSLPRFVDSLQQEEGSLLCHSKSDLQVLAGKRNATDVTIEVPIEVKPGMEGWIKPTMIKICKGWREANWSFFIFKIGPDFLRAASKRLYRLANPLQIGDGGSTFEFETMGQDGSPLLSKLKNQSSSRRVPNGRRGSNSTAKEVGLGWGPSNSEA